MPAKTDPSVKQNDRYANAQAGASFCEQQCIQDIRCFFKKWSIIIPHNITYIKDH